MQPTLEQKTRQGSPSSRVDMLGEVAKLLAENIPAGEAMDKLALTKALHDVLDARDDRGRAARRQIQMHILEVNERLAYGNMSEPQDGGGCSADEEEPPACRDAH